MQYLIYYPPGAGTQAHTYKVLAPSVMEGILRAHLEPVNGELTGGPIAIVSHVVPSTVLSPDLEEDVAEWLISVDGPYTGGTLVDQDSYAFRSRQIDLYRRVKLRRNARRDGGHLLAAPINKVIDTDGDSRDMVLGGVMMAQLNLAQIQSAVANNQEPPAAFGQLWRMQDNSYVPLDAMGMIGVGMAVGSFIRAVQERKNELDAAIEAAQQDILPLAALDVVEQQLDQGWPT